jgi:hypothetical protein
VKKQHVERMAILENSKLTGWQTGKTEALQSYKLTKWFVDKTAI